MDTEDVKEAARRAGDHDAVETAARVGYAINGLMHLLIGYIAMQLAFGGSGDSADQTGALSQLASNGFGRFVLWVGVLGFLGLAILQIAEGVGSNKETKDRLKAAAKGIVYLFLSWTAFTFARGDSSSSKDQTQDFTKTLMEQPFGAVLVGIVGVVVIGVGIYHVIKGWRKKFLSDLETHPGQFIVRSGQIGYIAKGIALGIVGGLFLLAAFRNNPDEARGLDGALRNLVDAPLGQPLLVFIALGFFAFGVYSFARARHGDV